MSTAEIYHSVSNTPWLASIKMFSVYCNAFVLLCLSALYDIYLSICVFNCVVRLNCFCFTVLSTFCLVFVCIPLCLLVYCICLFYYVCMFYCCLFILLCSFSSASFVLSPYLGASVFPEHCNIAVLDFSA